jgi:hypothetical protein
MREVVVPRSARPVRGLFGALLVVLAAAGCGSSSNLYNMWTDPTYQAGPMKNILIVTMKQNPVARRHWEDALAGELRARSVTATPSHALFPNAIPDTQAVVQAVRRDGYDGVLVIRALPPSLAETYVPGYTTREPVTRYNPWTNRYYTFWTEVHHPGYTETERVVRHEIHLWTTTEGGRLVWAGTGAVLDPRERGAVRQEIVDLILPELTRNGLIPPRSAS